MINVIKSNLRENDLVTDKTRPFSFLDLLFSINTRNPDAPFVIPLPNKENTTMNLANKDLQTRSAIYSLINSPKNS